MASAPEHTRSPGTGGPQGRPEVPGADGAAVAAPSSVVFGRYPAAPVTVRQVREAVTRLAAEHGAAGERLDDIRLAVSEAVTNVVVHAYTPTEAGELRIMATVGEGSVLVVIDDDGCGLSTPARTPGLGAGMRVMHELSEASRFSERPCGGSTVQMRLPLG